MSNARLVGTAATLLALALLVFVWPPGTASAEDPTAWPGEPPPMCTDHPCPGDVYEVVYSTTDGHIQSLVQYDPCGPPYYDCSASKPVTILGGGDAWINLVGDPRVGDIMKNLENYRIDVNTRQVVGPFGTPLPSPATTVGPSTSDASGLGAAGIIARYLLPAIGISAMVIVVGQGILRRKP